MKPNYLRVLLLIALAATAGCHKESQETVPPTTVTVDSPATSILTCYVDSYFHKFEGPFVSVFESGVRFTDLITSHGYFEIVTGGPENYGHLMIRCFTTDTVAIGTAFTQLHSTSNTVGTYYSVVESTWSANDDATFNHVTFSHVSDSLVEGTFQFRTQGGYHMVTDGNFHILLDE